LLKEFYILKESNEEVSYTNGAFIFCDKDGRTKIREVNNCIRAQCTRAGNDVKSANENRRTVTSEMDRKGFPIEIFVPWAQKISPLHIATY
jgi:hypothetical protein